MATHIDSNLVKAQDQDLAHGVLLIFLVPTRVTKDTLLLVKEDTLAFNITGGFRGGSNRPL